MEELIKSIVAKLGVSAESAKSAVEGVFGFLKSKLPADAVQSLSSSLGQGFSNLKPSTESLQALMEKAKIPTDKVPALMESVTGFLKDKLPEGAAAGLQSALGASGGMFSGMVDKVKGMFGAKT